MNKLYLIILLLALPINSWAIDLTFSWLPNPPEDEVLHYDIHYGWYSRNYTVTKDTGIPSISENRSVYTMLDIPEDKILFFAGTAHNATDNSDYSDEAVYYPEGFPTPISTETIISAGSDDAEESVSTGQVNITSSDLELTRDPNLQLIGIRFNNLSIPSRAIIVDSYILFTVDEVSTNSMELVINCEKIGNASTFTATPFNISSRPLTDTQVLWTFADWPIIGVSGIDQQTPNISNVIQEIVNRIDWRSGNSLAFIISGEGHHVAESYNGVPESAPKLFIKYAVDPGDLHPPVNFRLGP